MNRSLSASWLAALATAVGRAVGLVETGPILPVSAPASPSAPATPSSPTETLPADKWLTIAEDGRAVPSVWINMVDRRFGFIGNPLGAAAFGTA